MASISWIDWLCICSYFYLLIAIGLQSVNRDSTEDFAVAGRRISGEVIFASLAASFLGGGAVMGTASGTFSDGYVFFFAICAFSVQTVLVGQFVAPRLRHYTGAHTVGDVMAAHYGPVARLLTGLLSIAVCAGILGAQVLAVGTIFHLMLGTSKLAGIVVGMAFVLMYATFGGMWSVVKTSVAQFVIFSIFLPVVLLFEVVHAGGATELMANVPDGHTSFLGGWTPLAFIGVFASFLLGETLVPPYAQRAFAARTPLAGRRGFLLAGIFSVGFYFVTASIGFVASALYPQISPDQALPTVVSRLLPVGISGLVLAALFAVIMSTADSYLNATAVSFAKDIYLSFLHRGAGERLLLVVQRLVTVVVGVGAAIFAYSAPSIIDALLIAYNLWAPTVVAPLILGVVWGLRSRIAGVAAIVAGGAAMGIWRWELHEPFGVSALIVGVTVNIVIYALAYVLDPRSGRFRPPAEPERTTSARVAGLGPRR
ncbi:sodium:solute symporter family protein [Streptomyces sp. HC44]|uniref:Sodium:solute symporter family protein n=1 Tax=Streptomyces scabichelini TaxID=2711217 RepID=A0A6G4V285_9ACTN|nr:sodium:solute symporter family protein [Streptomyces scabichelini]